MLEQRRHTLDAATHTLTRGTLAAVVAAMERALVPAAPAGDAPVVIASFQRREHWDKARRRYDGLAAGAAAVVVVSGEDLDVPAPITAIRVPPDHVLAEVWSLTITGPTIGGATVAHDLQADDGEGSRDLFSGSWTFDPPQVAMAAERAGELLAPWLPPSVQALLRQRVDELARCRLGERERPLVEAIAALAGRLDRAGARATEREHALRTVLQESERDALTGAFNRRFLERFVRHRDDTGLPRRLGLVLVDVDGFKAVNDDFGHLVGDDALRTAASCIGQAVRADDLVVRWGGDEFLVLCPGLDRDGADHLAARLRATPVDVAPTGHAVRLTAAAASTEAGDLPMAELDAALYAAKRSGRADPA